MFVIRNFKNEVPILRGIGVGVTYYTAWIIHWNPHPNSRRRKTDTLRDNLWTRPGSGAELSCFHSIGQKLVTWPNLPARKAGKCSLSVGTRQGEHTFLVVSCPSQHSSAWRIHLHHDLVQMSPLWGDLSQSISPHHLSVTTPTLLDSHRNV